MVYFTIALPTECPWARIARFFLRLASEPRHFSKLMLVPYRGPDLTFGPQFFQVANAERIAPRQARRSSRRLVPKYCRYHRPIDSPPRFWCDRNCISHPIYRIRLNRICATDRFSEETTMTQLEQVMYAARAHAMRGRDGTSCSDRCSSSFLATAAVARAVAL